MLTEHGHGLEVPEENFIGLDPIIAILPHPLHGRLVERVMLMVNAHFNMKGVRYALTWRDGSTAFYQPVAPW